MKFGSEGPEGPSICTFLWFITRDVGKKNQPIQASSLEVSKQPRVQDKCPITISTEECMSC